MYTGDTTWTLKQVDWKQVGIMAFGFLNGVTGTAYHSTEPTPKSAFLHAGEQWEIQPRPVRDVRTQQRTLSQPPKIMFSCPTVHLKNL